jgi:hypothetical protein
MKNLSCRDLSDYLNLKLCLSHPGDHVEILEVIARCFEGVFAGSGSLRLVQLGHFGLHH